MNFTASNYIELYEETVKMYNRMNDGSWTYIHNDIKVHKSDKHIDITFPKLSGLLFTIFSMNKFNNTAGNNSTGINFVYNTHSSREMSFYDNDCSTEDLQYCTKEDVESLEFQFGTLHRSENIYTFMCYLDSINSPFSIYGAYINEPHILHQSLECMKDANIRENS